MAQDIQIKDLKTMAQTLQPKKYKKSHLFPNTERLESLKESPQRKESDKEDEVLFFFTKSLGFSTFPNKFSLEQKSLPITLIMNL